MTRPIGHTAACVLVMRDAANGKHPKHKVEAGRSNGEAGKEGAEVWIEVGGKRLRPYKQVALLLTAVLLFSGIVTTSGEWARS